MNVALIVGFASGIVTSIIANYIWSRRARLRLLVADRRAKRSKILDFDPAEVDLFALNRWTLRRYLDRDNLVMKISSERPPQKWFDEAEWNSLYTELAQSYSGDIAYLVDVNVDHRESAEGRKFRYTVAHCSYAEHLATVEYLKRHPNARSSIRAAIAGGKMLDFVRSSPPSSIKVNVALVTLDNRFLAIQRSSAVDFKKGVWTVGPNETMQLSRAERPGGVAEDLFGMSERCLREELNLEPSDYGNLNISWLGIDAGTCQVKVYAQVKTHLSRRELDRRISDAHSLYEAQDFQWLKFNRENVNDILANWERGDQTGRVWSASAPHALQELWRMRAALQLPDLM
jgi:hypothetical protein